MAQLRFETADEAATARLAAWLAAALSAAKTMPCLVHLNGDLGAGKTAFARGIIRAVMGAATKVPSPTFTLIQPYDGALPILHADLYRLAAPEEVEELGLRDALGEHICLIEWADKAADYLPAPDIVVQIDMTESGRALSIDADDAICAALHAAAARDAAVQAFLEKTAWADAARRPLAGDASTRRYERLQMNDKSAVLMDWAAAPDGPAIYDGQSYSQIAHLAEAMPQFSDMVAWLRAADLPAPQIYHCDRAQGFALMEDFGDRTIANDAKIDRAVFYHEAIANLLHLHGQTPPDFLPLYDGAVQAVEASLFTDYYLPFCGVTPSDAAKAAWQKLWQGLGNSLLQDAPVAVLRDYHSVNLVWRAAAQGRYRAGLIDVQDALIGHAAYDVASLVCDARIDVDPTHAAAAKAQYLTARFGTEAAGATARENFERAFAVCAVQRNLKIAGIFVRLAQRDGKPAYLAHLPRILGYLTTHLAHDALAPISDWLAAEAPAALQIMAEDNG